MAHLQQYDVLVSRPSKEESHLIVRYDETESEMSTSLLKVMSTSLLVERTSSKHIDVCLLLPFTLSLSLLLQFERYPVFESEEHPFEDRVLRPPR